VFLLNCVLLCDVGAGGEIDSIRLVPSTLFEFWDMCTQGIKYSRNQVLVGFEYSRESSTQEWNRV
jgi:hypothetical protein